MKKSTQHASWLALILCALCVWVQMGCNLPGLPTDLNEEPRTDLGTPDVDRVQVCEPSTRECLANAVKVCSADGTDFEIRPCASDETCADGYCVPLENTCSKGQPFALSTTEVVYELTADNKSQTAVVTLDNCGVDTLFVEQVDVRGPIRGDMQPVFRLSADTPSRLILDPGESFDIKVVYAPSVGFTQVEGSLDLGIITSEYGRFSVGLRTSSRCFSATPSIDWKPTENDDEKRVAWLQNCGTEPLDVTGVESLEFSVEPLDKLPLTLLPGRHFGVRIALPEAAGSFDGRVLFAVGDDEAAITEVRGIRLAEGCFEEAGEISMRFAVNNVPTMADDGFLGVVPTDIIRFFSEGVPDGWTAEYWPVFVPPSFTTSLQRLGDEMVLSPIVAGNYAYELVILNDEGVPACEFPSVEIDSWPESGVWAELTWVNVSDLVDADTGFATGVNLDLHVKPRTSAWLSPDDCQPGDEQPCTIARGIASSSSGASPEIVSYPAEFAGELEFGIYLSNPFNFAGAQASLRIWQGRRLIDVRSAFLSEAGNFWLVGRFDPTTGQFTEIDSLTDGFPR